MCSHDAERAMRGQAFGASGPSWWTDVRCLRAITSTTIRPVLLPCGAVQTSSPRAVRDRDDQAGAAALRRRPAPSPLGAWTSRRVPGRGRGLDVCARSHAHDELHARSPASRPASSRGGGGWAEAARAARTVWAATARTALASWRRGRPSSFLVASCGCGFVQSHETDVSSHSH